MTNIVYEGKINNISYDFKNGLSVFNNEEGLFGYVDKDLNVVIYPVYNYASDFCKGYAVVTKSNIDPFNETDIYSISHQSQYYINTLGQITNKPKIDFEIKEIKKFSEGLCAVKVEDNKWGFINKDFEMVVFPQFDYVEDYEDGVAICKTHGYYYLVNKTGLILNKTFYGTMKRDSHMIIATSIKNNMEYAFNPYMLDKHFIGFSCIKNFNDGIAVCSLNYPDTRQPGSYYLRQDGKYFRTGNCTNYDFKNGFGIVKEDLGYVTKGNVRRHNYSYRYINKVFNYLELKEKKYSNDLVSASPFEVSNEGIKNALITVEKTWTRREDDLTTFRNKVYLYDAVINEYGEFLIKPLNRDKYTLYRENNSIFKIYDKKKELYGLIDINGKKILDIKYRKIKVLSNGMFIVNDYEILDRSGKKIFLSDYVIDYDVSDDYLIIKIGFDKDKNVTSIKEIIKEEKYLFIDPNTGNRGNKVYDLYDTYEFINGNYLVSKIKEADNANSNYKYNEYYLINKKLEIIKSFNSTDFEYLECFSNESCIIGKLKRKNEYIVLDLNGNLLLKIKTEHIELKGSLLVIDGNKEGTLSLITLNGKVLIDSYEKIKLINEEMVLVSKFRGFNKEYYYFDNIKQEIIEIKINSIDDLDYSNELTRRLKNE